MNSDFRKIKSKEYAEFISKGERDDTKKNMLRSALHFSESKEDDDSAQSTVSVSSDENHVGIWTAHKKNGQTIYIRDPSYRNVFYRWSKRDIIPPKSKEFRIAYLGESAARGYLLDSYITPAQILEKTLNQNVQQKEVEVIDLSCVGIELTNLQKLCKEAVQLKPDLLVLFAGNNWRVMLQGLTTQEQSELLMAKTQAEMLERFYMLSKHKTDAQIKMLFATLNELSKEFKIPITILIPEFNLKDWKHSSFRNFFPIQADHNQVCMQLKSEIEAAFLNNEYTVIAKKAKELIELDGMSALGYEYLAQCMLHDGNLPEARNNYEKAKDTGVYMPYDVRCCYSFIAKTMEEQAKKCHFSIVNLPELFKKGCNNIPGYDLFLDYCHLNLNGMELAMKYTAESILPMLGNNSPLAPERVHLEDEKLSKVYFIAAIHCAHYAQPYTILYDYCLKSLQLSPKISGVMISYIKLVTSKVTGCFSAELNQILKSGIAPYLVQDDKYRSMDLTLIEAIIHVLQEYGIDLNSEIEALRYREHQVTRQALNLLEPFYHSASYEEKSFFSAYEKVGLKPKNPIYRRIKNLESGFFFIADTKENIKLKLTIRNICENQKKLTLFFEVNGRIIMRFIVGNAWKDITCHIEKTYLSEGGMNRIRLITESYSNCFAVSNPDYVGLCDRVINNLYSTHCQILKFTAEINGS